MHAATPCRLPLLAALLLVLAVPLAHADEESPRIDVSSPAAIKKALADREPALRLAAARAAATVQDAILVAPLVRCLDDDVEDVRAAAAEALRARDGAKDRREAARGTARHLKPLAREPDARALAAEDLLVPLLHDLAEPVAIDALLDVHAEAPMDRIEARLLAVANIPAAAAIDALIGYASKRRAGDGHRAAVAKALRYATGESFGGDPDVWRAWWREAEKHFDFAAAAERRAEQRAKRAKADEKKAERKRRRDERKDEEEG